MNFFSSQIYTIDSRKFPIWLIEKREIEKSLETKKEEKNCIQMQFHYLSDGLVEKLSEFHFRLESQLQ